MDEISNCGFYLQLHIKKGENVLFKVVYYHSSFLTRWACIYNELEFFSKIDAIYQFWYFKLLNIEFSI